MYAISPIVDPTPENGLKRHTPQVVIDLGVKFQRAEYIGAHTAYVSIPPELTERVATLGYTLVEEVV